MISLSSFNGKKQNEGVGETLTIKQEAVVISMETKKQKNLQFLKKQQFPNPGSLTNEEDLDEYLTLTSETDSRKNNTSGCMLKFNTLLRTLHQ